MSNLWRYKDEIMLILSFLLIGLYVLFLLAGITMIGENTVSEIVVVMGFIFIFTGLPGIVLLKFGLKARRKQKELEKLANFLRRNQRIRIRRLAKYLDKSVIDTYSILDEGIEKGIIHGKYEEQGKNQVFKYEEPAYKY